MDLSNGALKGIQKEVTYPGHIGRDGTRLYEAVRRAGSAVDLDARPPLQGRSGSTAGRGWTSSPSTHGVNLAALDALRGDPRSWGSSPGEGPSTSRGSSSRWGTPLFAEFDYLMEILLEEEVVASLGDGVRPGCHHDENGSRRQRSISPWGCRRNGLSGLRGPADDGGARAHSPRPGQPSRYR